MIVHLPSPIANVTTPRFLGFGEIRVNLFGLHSSITVPLTPGVACED